MVQALCARLARSGAFQAATTTLILFNAVLMGLETSSALMERWGSALGAAHLLLQVAFVAEISIRLTAYAPRVWHFFRDGWNVFDFVIVALSLLPSAGAFATVARLARLLRAARLVSVIPELRLIVQTMLKSIPSMGHVILLLSLLLYIYGVAGFHLFRGVDAENWATLGRSILTLFEILTLEGWVEIQEKAFEAHSWAWIYFASFILMTVFVVVNLFIAVVIGNLEDAKSELQAQKSPSSSQEQDLEAEIQKMRESLDRLEQSISKVNRT